MKCCICAGDIEAQMFGNKVVYDQGHNAEPVVLGGRCCEHCNWTVVIPARMEAVIKGCSLIIHK